MLFVVKEFAIYKHIVWEKQEVVMLKDTAAANDCADALPTRVEEGNSAIDGFS